MVRGGYQNRKRMDKIVFATGVFDLFHLGHLNFLQQAAELGDRLIVGVMTDEWAKKNKGEAPILPLYHRLRLVAGLSCVDVAFPISGPKDEVGAVLMGVTIRAVGPNHGYLSAHQPLKEKMEAAGIKYVTIPRTPNVSTTMIKERCYEKVCGDRNSTGGNSAGKWYYPHPPTTK